MFMRYPSSIMFALLFLLLGAICPTLAHPVPRATLNRLYRRDISPSLVTEFTRFSQFAASANCQGNHNGSSTGSSVYCDSGYCNTLRKASTQIIDGFEEIKPGGTTGYLALDKTNKYIVLTFRGTVSAENRNADLDFQQLDVSTLCEGCKAHHGFWAASEGAMDVLLPKVEEALRANPDYRIVLTGHSLGGALATLGAVTLRNAGHTVDLYSFGAPSVGNKAFAEYITKSTAGKNYRITHSNDEVPKVLFRSSRRWPLDSLVPEYSQSSPEYWITSANGVSATKSSIRVIEGVNNEAGNLGTTEVTMDPHGWYLGDMSVCAQTWKDWE